MSKNKSANKFKDYFYKKLSKDEIYNKNNINKINFNKAKLFENFVLHLLQVIDDTYLGLDYFNSYYYQKDHFDWCWIQTIYHFQNENIDFYREGEHYSYFLDYLIECFYKTDNPLDEMLKLKKFWKLVMCLDCEKTESEYEIFLDTYMMLYNHLNFDK